MPFTEDDVLQILKLIEESSFDELHLEMGDLKLDVRKGGCGGEAPPPTIDTPVRSPLEAEVEPGTRRGIQSVQEGASANEEKGLVPIPAPLLGIFYRCPSPGAPPYVELGALVHEEETVCLIEVMKVFNAVKAGVRGRVERICAESGQFVEYGEPLFWVKPLTDVERT
jgi:acetyl-CoA carboxylase biotin carboxyl carrier protein